MLLPFLKGVKAAVDAGLITHFPPDLTYAEVAIAFSYLKTQR